MDEVGAFLEVADIRGVGSGLQLDFSALEIHSDVDFHLIIDGRVDFHPGFLQRGVPVRWDRDFAELDLAGGDFVSLQGLEIGFYRE